MKPPLRVAAWSGPRNTSTAMMRAWDNRGDCAVSDEPLYAHYLAQTRLDHPGCDEVIAAGDTDWRRVVAALTGPVPGGQALWYQKHMAHHLLPGIQTGWVHRLVNLFLVRDPTLVVASATQSGDPVQDDEDMCAAAVATYALPLKLNVVVAIAAAIVAGLLIDHVTPREAKPVVEDAT